MGACCSAKKPILSSKSPEIHSNRSTHTQRGESQIVSLITLKREIRDEYHLGKVIGSGHFGSVRVAKQINTDKKFAIKTIEKRKVIHDLHLLKREVEILMSLDHPNLIKTYACYEDARYMHIVTELCTGGELYDRLATKTRYKEKGAAKIMRQILLAVNTLHVNGICHRDLKPENFLFSTPEKPSILKLIDFGLSCKFGSSFDRRMDTVVGTPYYIAPEVLSGDYGIQCDIWSVGIIMYMLLCGNPPFQGQTTNEIFKKILTNGPKFKARVWIDVSEEAKALITAMLSRVPTSRPTASDVLKSHWFANSTSRVIKIEPTIIDALINYKAESRFKKEALSVIVKNLSIHEILELKNAFIDIDTGNTGDLSFEEIEQALRNQGYNFASDKIQNIMGIAGINSKGRINYSDFLRMTLSSKSNLVEQKLWEAFKIFDVDNSGRITADNLQQAFSKMGKDFDSETIRQMISEADFLKTNSISFDEFKMMFGTAIPGAVLVGEDRPT